MCLHVLAQMAGLNTKFESKGPVSQLTERNGLFPSAALLQRTQRNRLFCSLPPPFPPPSLSGTLTDYTQAQRAQGRSPSENPRREVPTEMPAEPASPARPSIITNLKPACSSQHGIQASIHDDTHRLVAKRI